MNVLRKMWDKRDVIFLSIGFNTIIASYIVVEYFTINFLKSLGYGDLGFLVLVAVYIGFLFGGFVSGTIVSKFGAKKVLITFGLIYSIHSLSYLSGNVPFILGLGVLLGFFGGSFHNASSTYLTLVAGEKRGKYSGAFNLCLSIMITVLGATVGKISSIFGNEYGIIMLSTLSFIAWIFYFFMKDIRVKEERDIQIKKVFKFVKKPDLYLSTLPQMTARIIAAVWGGYIVVKIGEDYGIEYVGYAATLANFVMLLTVYLVGTISDKIGRINIGYILIISNILSLILFLIGNKYTLIAGVVIMGFIFSLSSVFRTALIGDVAEKRNIEMIAGAFSTIRTIGYILAILTVYFLGGEISNWIVLILSFILGAVFIYSSQKGMSHYRERINS